MIRFTPLCFALLSISSANAEIIRGAAAIDKIIGNTIKFRELPESVYFAPNFTGGQKLEDKKIKFQWDIDAKNGDDDEICSWTEVKPERRCHLIIIDGNTVRLGEDEVFSADLIPGNPDEL